jgi:hypothetical protein
MHMSTLMKILQLLQRNHVMFQLKTMAFRLNKNKVFDTHCVHRAAWNFFQHCYDFILKNESMFLNNNKNGVS